MLIVFDEIFCNMFYCIQEPLTFSEPKVSHYFKETYPQSSLQFFSLSVHLL